MDPSRSAGSWGLPAAFAVFAALLVRTGRADPLVAGAAVLAVVLGVGFVQRLARGRGAFGGLLAGLTLSGVAVAWTIAEPAAHRDLIALAGAVAATGLSLAGAWPRADHATRTRLAVLGAAVAGVILATGTFGAPLWPLKAAMVLAGPPLTAALLVPMTGPLLALAGAVAAAAAVGPAHALAWLLPPILAGGLLSLRHGRVREAAVLAMVASLLPPAGLALGAGLLTGLARRRRSPWPLLLLLPAAGLALWRLPPGVSLLSWPSPAVMASILPLSAVALPFLLPAAVLGLASRRSSEGDARDVLGVGLLALPFLGGGPWLGAAAAALWLAALPGVRISGNGAVQRSLPWSFGASTVVILGALWGSPPPLVASTALLAAGWTAALLLSLIPHRAARLAWVLAVAGLIWTTPVEGGDRHLEPGQGITVPAGGAVFLAQAVGSPEKAGTEALAFVDGTSGALRLGRDLPVPGSQPRHPLMLASGRGRRAGIVLRGVSTRKVPGQTILEARRSTVVRMEPLERWKHRRRRLAALMGGVLLLLLAALLVPRSATLPATLGLTVVLAGLFAAGSGFAPLARPAFRDVADLAVVAFLAGLLALRHLRNRKLLAGFLILAPLALAQPLLRHPAGDEVYQLLIDRSLVADHDLDISNNIDPTKPSEVIYSPHGSQLIHSPLPALVALPGYITLGMGGALLTVAFLMALAAWAAARRAAELGASRLSVDTAWGLVLLGCPALIYGTQLWPAAFGAAAAALLLLAAARPAPLTAAAAAGLSLLVKVRLGLLTLPLAAVAGFRGRSRRAVLVTAAAAMLALTGVALLLGGPLGRHSLGELVPSDPVAFGRGLWGLLWDASAGLAFAAPLWLVALAFLPSVWRRGGPGERALIAGAALTVFALAPRGEWYGGGSPPVRYLAPVLPLALLALVETMGSARGRRLVRLVLPLGALAAWVAVTRPLWWFNPGDGGWWLADSLSRALTVGGRRLFPSLIRPNVAALAFPALFVALAWAWSRRPTHRVAAAALAVAALAGGLAAAVELPEWRVHAEDPQVVHHGGHADPPPGAFFRAAHAISWRLEPGQSLAIPWRPPRHARLFVRVRGSMKAPGGGRLLADWGSGSLSALRWAGEGWRRLPLPPVPVPGRASLRLRWDGPPGTAVLIDRVEASR